LAIYWLNSVIISKENPFSLLPPVSLNVIRFTSFSKTNKKKAFNFNSNIIPGFCLQASKIAASVQTVHYLMLT